MLHQLLKAAGLGKRGEEPWFGYRRHEYKSIWNSVSGTENQAKEAVSGTLDEQEHAASAKLTYALLRDTVGVRPDDVVLDIGAGFGRVGEVVAPLCKKWIGVDASDNMVSIIRRRLAHLPNVEALVNNGYDLSPIPSGSVDMVYCTVVFMHLDEWERYSYVKEAFRVLKPGGRLLVDNINLLSDDGWNLFLEHGKLPPHERPPHISRTSTPQELHAYFKRAGFEQIAQKEFALWVVTTGVKPQ